MKTLIKITKRLFVILLFLSLTNCERDKIHSETEQQGVKRIHRISIADFNSKVAKNKKYNKLQSYFDTYVSNKNDSNSKIEQGDDVTIQTDEVLLIQTDSIDYYTFKLLTDNTDNTFYNLVVNVNDQDEIAKSVIFEYNPSENWLQDTAQAYSGYVSVADNDIISLEDLFTAKFGDECIIGSTSYWICNENVLGHYEGHPSCDQATAWENVVTPIYAPCDELTSGNYYIAGDEDNADGGGPTNGGTGNPPNDNDPVNDEEDVVSTIPTPADYVAPIINCINGLGQTDGVTLSQDIIDWLHQNNDKKIANPLTQMLDDNSCSVDAQVIVSDFLTIKKSLPSAKFERYLELLEITDNDPWALIQNCAEQNGLDTSNYLDLYNLPFPEECTNRLAQLGNGFGGNPAAYMHQPITDGNVPLANIDYYGVEIVQNPDFNNDGTPDSESEMYQAFRDNFIDLASGEKEDFQFNCNVPGNPTNTGDVSWDFVPFLNGDEALFVSDNPITAILLIESEAEGLLPSIANDEGAVIVSDFTQNDWTISTIRTPSNGSQPFSGNRQWGWIINQNGNLELFTRAVDVANVAKILNILSFGSTTTECQQDTYYDIAEATWQNMQEEIAQWVNENGGQANIVPSTAVRVDKEKIEELLTSNETIEEINCD